MFHAIGWVFKTGSAYMPVSSSSKFCQLVQESAGEDKNQSYGFFRERLVR